MRSLPPQAILKARFGELAESLGLDLSARRQAGKFYFTVRGSPRSTQAFIQASFPHAWVTSGSGDMEVYGLPLEDVERVLVDCQLAPEWLQFNDGVALRIARQIREKQDFRSLPVLGDALEEGGCSHREILSHCRSGERHRPTCCWVIDLLLGPARGRRAGQ